MKTELIAPVALSPDALNRLGKLLLNAWSAEYALRITPVINDEEYLQNALLWTFPQAYYAAQYSLRGVLLTLGESGNQTLSLLAASTVLHQYGLYHQTQLRATYLAELNALRLSHAMHINDPARECARLARIVEQVSLAHETHIADVIGVDAYCTLLSNVPEYLKNSFLTRRLSRVLAYQKEVASV